MLKHSEMNGCQNRHTYTQCAALFATYCYCLEGVWDTTTATSTAKAAPTTTTTTTTSISQCYCKWTVNWWNLPIVCVSTNTPLMTSVVYCVIGPNVFRVICVFDVRCFYDLSHAVCVTEEKWINQHDDDINDEPFKWHWFASDEHWTAFNKIL